MGFYFNMYKKDNKVFITSLYKINCAITKKETPKKDKATIEEINQKLPNTYKAYLDIFLKAALDQLLLY